MVGIYGKCFSSLFDFFGYIEGFPIFYNLSNFRSLSFILCNLCLKLLYCIILAVWVVGMVVYLFQLYMLFHFLGHQHIGMLGCEILLFLFFFVFEVVDYVITTVLFSG